MPKNRHKNTPQAPENSAQGSSGHVGPALSPVRLGSAGLSLLVALVATGILVWGALGLGDVPGCGIDEGCGKATDSAFGKIPLGEQASWAVSYLGFAFYLAVGAGLVLHRRGITSAYKAVVALGVLGSLFYLVVMALNWGDYFCQYCLTSHIANFVFAGAILSAPAARGALKPLTTLAVIGATFLISTGVLAGGQAWVDRVEEAEANAEADASTSRIIDRSTTANDPTPDITPPQTTIAENAEQGIDSAALPRTAYRTDESGFTGRYRLGPKDAPVRIVVFSRYGCPSCAIIEKEILEILEARDDVSFSHKHFPFEFECNSSIRSRRSTGECNYSYWVEAVGTLYGPDAFWRFHTYVYDAVREKTPISGPDAVVRALGYDPAPVNRLVQNDPRFKEWVQADVAEAQLLGLNKTPTVYINGEEMRGWNARGNLTRVVNNVANSGISRGTPDQDQPIQAMEKYISDYYATGKRVRSMGQDVNASYFGAEDAPVDMQIFFGYDTEDLLPTLRAFNDLAAEYPKAVRLTVRHYAMSEDCNMFSERNRTNNSCEMHHALEAAAMLGGLEAFRDCYTWFLENGELYDPRENSTLAETIGLDLEDFENAMAEQAVQDAVMEDAVWLNEQKLRALVPIVFVNNRRVDRYIYENDRTSVLETIIRRELGLER